MKDLPWVIEARKHIGLKEIPGPKHNPIILQWLKNLKAWWSDDETPWCGVFVGEMLRITDRYVPALYMRALEWNNAGLKLSKPAYGCLVTFSRSGGGHVGFCVGEDQQGRLMILGGNQSNAVSIAPFDKARVVGYIWPATKDGQQLGPLPGRYELPLYNANGIASSKNEA